jgi:hypothetical protein
MSIEPPLAPPTPRPPDPTEPPPEPLEPPSEPTLPGPKPDLPTAPGSSGPSDSQTESVARVIGLIRLIDTAWWGPTGRGGLAGAAWRVKVSVQNRRQASPKRWNPDVTVLPTLTRELRTEVARVVAKRHSPNRDLTHVVSGEANSGSGAPRPRPRPRSPSKSRQVQRRAPASP